MCVHLQRELRCRSFYYLLALAFKYSLRKLTKFLNKQRNKVGAHTFLFESYVYIVRKTGVGLIYFACLVS
jgi:hypothetical protein